MKIKNLLLIFFSILLVNCSKENKNKDYVIISGAVENPIIDSITLTDINYTLIHTIHLDKNNSFNDTISVSKGYYFLSDRQNSINLFLSPSMNLNATISYNENVASSLFQKKGANENNYLRQKNQFNRSFEKVEHYEYFLNLDEETFLKLVDSINTEKVTFLRSQKNIDTDFLLCETFSIEYEKISLLNRYKQWHGEMIKEPDFKVSNNYPNPYENIDISNEKLLKHKDFIECLLGFIFFKMDYDWANKLNLLIELETIDKELKNQKIKDKVAYEAIRFQTDDIVLDDIYSKYMSMAQNTKYREEIEEKYSTLKKIAKGAISPSFEFYDVNDSLVTLESLRGKLVYIDVWATFCIPCVKEIPALNKLEEEFRNKDIYFVSMCSNDTKENFEKMIVEKELGGIQLFVPDEHNDFFKKYIIKGLPRFILIDKNGFIIDAHAMKPSNPKLKEQILENL